MGAGVPVSKSITENPKRRINAYDAFVLAGGVVKVIVVAVLVTHWLVAA
jgi:hypothetical protein